MKSFALVLGSALVLAGATLSAPAAAQSADGTFQLGLTTPIIAHSSVTVTVEGPLDTETDTDVSTTSWGLGQSVAGELGYGLNDSLVLGAFVQLGGTSRTTEYENGPEVDADSFTLFLGPKLDYMFLEGKTVRPFVGGIVGLSVESTDSGDTETSLTGLELQGRVGLRAFVTESFSIDPAFYMGWGTAWGDIDNGVTSNDIDATAFNVGVTLGLSGWIH